MQCLTLSSVTSNHWQVSCTNCLRGAEVLPSLLLIPLHSLSTFYPLEQLQSLWCLQCVVSDAIGFITVDLLEATALVEYSNGERCSYSSVSVMPFSIC